MVIAINKPTYYAEVMVTEDWYSGYKATIKEVKVCVCEVWIDVKHALPKFVLDMVAYRAKVQFHNLKKKNKEKTKAPVPPEEVTELPHEKKDN